MENKIEAFCQEDNWILWISWILNEDHKSHNLSNIDSAYISLLSEWTANIKKVNDQKSSLIDTEIMVNMSMEKLNKDKETAIKELKTTFEDIQK